MTTAPVLAPVLVVGVGREDAGDDAVGPVVARLAGALLASEHVVVGGPAVEVLDRVDPTDLALLWRGRELAVLVDAVRSDGDPPGTVRTTTVAGGTAYPVDWPSGRADGTHDFGVATAVGLSALLGTLPERLVLVGVEGVDFTVGDPMDAVVEAAVPEAVACVAGAVRDTRTPCATTDQ